MTFQPTGYELMKAFSGVNEKQAVLIDHSPADQEALMQQIDTGGSFEGVYRKHWEEGEWRFPPLIPTTGGQTLEEVIRRVLNR